MINILQQRHVYLILGFHLQILTEGSLIVYHAVYTCIKIYFKYTVSDTWSLLPDKRCMLTDSDAIGGIDDLAVTRTAFWDFCCHVTSHNQLY